MFTNMACGKMDDAVKDYLIFRGLHATAKAIENELKAEKDRAFCVSMARYLQIIIITYSCERGRVRDTIVNVA